MQSRITMVECPRDAMQGWKRMIPTEEKVRYLNMLLQVGFDVLDFGSFVSPKAIPQMADTANVLPLLNMANTHTKLLAIIANTRGAQDAVQYDQISYLGFPFSISETFQKRNTNKSIAASLKEVEEIQQLCVQHGKQLVVYISMGFGNPYGDAYNADVAIEWVGKLSALGIKIISLSDTVGVAVPDTIAYLFCNLIPAFSEVEFGAHFHSHPDSWGEKIQAAFEAGSRRFDSAMNGIGGCPMAEDELVGNIATERLKSWCDSHNIQTGIKDPEFVRAMHMAQEIFI
ncbi:MAG: hydroxymethylglutaryl-CoA lyase [Taibaiella sp.]|nr:hydroxymethylglutaryl-CoA lyase [Taibaiella sp.]